MIKNHKEVDEVTRPAKEGEENSLDKKTYPIYVDASCGPFAFVYLCMDMREWERKKEWEGERDRVRRVRERGRKTLEKSENSEY